MKKIFILLLGIVMSIGFVHAQNNTLYLMKPGNVVDKPAVTEIDSVLLHKPAQATASELRFPVRASANGRYLVDARGAPFLLHGDTSWSLINQLTREEVEEYLENRRHKGFNAILTTLIRNSWADNPPKNKYGEAPFTTPEDFSTTNEAYFTHADWVIHKANEKGILVVLNPADVSYHDKDGWARQIVANGPTKCRDFGRYLGNRYKGYPNIIWQAGGDRTLEVGSALEKNWLEILRGIKEHAQGHLWTAHWSRFSTALDQSTFARYMDVDNAYGGNRTYIQTLRAYNRANPKPTFLNEAYYEADELSANAGTPQMMRAQAYWAILSGATGHFFGSYHVWVLVLERDADRIQLYPKNPFYWQYRGKPVLLLGGSSSDCLFQGTSDLGQIATDSERPFVHTLEKKLRLGQGVREELDLLRSVFANRNRFFKIFCAHISFCIAKISFCL